METIDLTPSPAQHFRILARIVDGMSPHNYVSIELRRIASIYDEARLTWDDLNDFLNSHVSKRTHMHTDYCHPECHL